MSDSKKSPFAELSFSQQQEQWRSFRAEKLNYQSVSKPQPPAPKPCACASSRPPMRPMPAFDAPQHANLDRIHARISAAARHTGAFQPVNPNA